MVFRKLAMTIALSVPLGACGDVCGNYLVSRADAPGGALSAMMFQRDCGAMTGFTTQVSILRPGELPTGKGNAFIADDDHGAARTGHWGGPWAEIRWLGPDRLRIRYASGTRIFLRREEEAGVRITYQQANE